MFVDRVDAGRKLAASLKQFADAADTVVLGIPRGGVVVAAEVARELRLPLDIVLAAKVGAPGNPEFAVGALSADGELLGNPLAGLSDNELAAVAGDARAKIAHQLASLRGDLPPLPLAEKTVLVVDDGLATGLTARAAVRYVRRAGARRVVLAVPVAAADSLHALEADADTVVAFEVRADFFAVGQFYASFGQTQDEEVKAVLSRARGSGPAPPN